MRDGKQIIFTHHAKIRSFQRKLGHYILLMERFKNALRWKESFRWKEYSTALYYDNTGTVYVVGERPDRYIIITVFPLPDII